MKYAIMDNKGIIEDFRTEEEAFHSIERVRQENKDIEGDLLIVHILAKDN